MPNTGPIQQGVINGVITARQAMYDIRDLTAMQSDGFHLGIIKMMAQNPDWGEPEDGTIWA